MRSTIAEEVRSPERKVPRAVLTSLVTVASVITFSCLALLLTIPDIDAAMSGADPDPITTTLGQFWRGNHQTPPGDHHPGIHRGDGGAAGGCIAIDFRIRQAGCFTCGQGSEASQQTDRLHQHPLVSAVASLIVLALSASQVYGALIAFATGRLLRGLHLSSAGRPGSWAEGAWKAGPFSLGVLRPVVNVAALLWLGFEIVNIAWPRQPEAPWYQNYAVIVVFVLLGLAGALRWRGTCVDAIAAPRLRRQRQERETEPELLKVGP